METKRLKIRHALISALLLFAADSASASSTQVCASQAFAPILKAAAATTTAVAASATTRAPAARRFSEASLESAARKHAYGCRRSAKFMGSRMICGNRSKGMCNRATQEIIRDGLGVNIPVVNSYAGKKAAYDRALTKLNVSSCDQAPAGAVCLYSTTRHQWGHTEVKTGIGFCSDFCSHRAANNSPRGKFTFQGAYMPKK